MPARVHLCNLHTAVCTLCGVQVRFITPRLLNAVGMFATMALGGVLVGLGMAGLAAMREGFGPLPNIALLSVSMVSHSIGSYAIDPFVPAALDRFGTKSMRGMLTSLGVSSTFLALVTLPLVFSRAYTAYGGHGAYSIAMCMGLIAALLLGLVDAATHERWDGAPRRVARALLLLSDDDAALTAAAAEDDDFEWEQESMTRSSFISQRASVIGLSMDSRASLVGPSMGSRASLVGPSAAHGFAALPQWSKEPALDA